MALDDRQHVEATAILNRVTEEAPHLSGEVLDAAEQWLKENRPSTGAYSNAAKSLGGELDEGSRESREEKVIDTVREWLPEITEEAPSVIQIKPADSKDHDGAIFSVTRTRTTFVCRR